jgi:hypothetical protein
MCAFFAVVLCGGAVGGSVLASVAEARRPLKCSQQSGALRFCRARTDNYKDCFNTPDNSRERRSWLSFTSIRARGVSWTVDPDQEQFADIVAVRRQKNVATKYRRLPSAARMTIRLDGGASDSTMYRHGPPNLMWGPFIQRSSDGDFSSDPIAVRIRLERTDGRWLASRTVQYRYDSALQNAGASSPEHNGPGGRWYIGSKATPTDIEAGASHEC